jgi:hypothetical protein
MDAILFSADPNRVDVEVAKKHLADHGELYWGLNSPIVRGRFSYPMYGYLHMCGGQVEYRVSIRDIVPFSHNRCEDRALRPGPWILAWQENRDGVRAEPWKNDLVLTEIVPFPYDTYSFQKWDGAGRIKQAPQSYTRVLPPSHAPVRR